MTLRFSFPKYLTPLFPFPMRFFKNILLFTLGGFFLAALAWPPSSLSAGPADGQLINCDIQETACTQPLGGGTVTLDIHPKPVKAMSDLTFHVTFKDIVPAEAPFIDLGMPGMKMGPNRVQLKQSEAGAPYTGTGIIVRCPSGRTIWKAAVTIPGAGTVDYVFNVIY